MELDKISSPNDWEYFAKGAANVLFKYTGSNAFLTSKLLRLRISKSNLIPTEILYKFLELKCKPIFQDNLIECEFVRISDEFVQQLQSPVEIGNDLGGLLLPNMLSGDFSSLNLSKWFQLHYDIGIKQVILEIKPKWLYKCVSNYCRTCSLSQMRGYARHFCPLDFVYDPDCLIDDLFSRVPEDILEVIESRVVCIRTLLKEYLCQQDNIFQQLAKLQEIKTSRDVIENLTCANDVSDSLSFIMTLRDVGVFLKFQPNHPITCKIYDLDLKPNEKYSHWVKVEQNLQPYYNSTNENWKYCKRRT
ncbi:Inositol-pentakisphosphate 2-kinase [Spathaspora sp. JA1]|nr:Inositol-pentakisphosphate 2-kinase [Spathaspora sp. JA1]